MAADKTIRVLLIDPGKHPRIVEVEHKLENLQALVGGYIEAVYPWDDPVALVCDEEGKCKSDTLPNRMLDKYDQLVGPVFICGLGEENFASITDELALKYAEKFWMPETFFRTGAGLLVIRDDDGTTPSMEALLEGGTDDGIM